MQDQIQAWLEADDVFRPEFLAGIIFVTPEGCQADYSSLFGGISKHHRVEWWTAISSSLLDEGLQSGPYVMVNRRICKALRLYDDVNGGFIVATKPQVLPG